ncbi:MAG: serine protease [Rhodomicrobium sp.]|nr:MAG: serine protease [Rhodomicrobium sp.]
MTRRFYSQSGSSGVRIARQAEIARAEAKRTGKVKVATPLPHSSTLLRDGLILLGISLLLLTLMFVSRAEARDNSSLADLAEKLQDSVVNISTSQKVTSPFPGGQMPQLPKGSPGERRFKEFLERNKKNRTKKVSSLGSGFVIDAGGLIVTNNHVIKGADEIFVNFVDGTKLKVEKVLGVDAKSDIALLKVTPTKPLKAVSFGSSDKSRVGDWVMAIGNPFGLGGTVTIGIVSAKNRDINAGPYDEFIQTDAAINRGNSGGPLFNMSGEVIGVNTAIISPTGGSIGIGFSVPSDTVVNIVEQLKKYGKTRRGWLGVLIQRVTPDIAEGFGLTKPKGALVARVTKGGPAEKAGMVPSDIIVEFDGSKVKTSRQLPKIVALTPVDKEVDVVVLRDGEEKTLKIKVALLQVNPVTDVNLEGNEPADDPEEMKISGLTLGVISPEFRQKYRLSPKMKGVAILAVDPKSAAAKKGVRAGHVIVDVMQETVSVPDDVKEKVEQLKKSNKKNIIFFISRGNGEFGFVALPTTEDNKG